MPQSGPSDPASPLAGLPARYVDLGAIAVGGMAEVRRVRDVLLRSTVVMKVCLPAVAADPTLRERFVDEARLTAQLHHPGIVAVHDLGDLPDGRPFFTMEEVRGGTFEALIHARVRGDPGAWSLRRMLEAFRRACEGVAYAHSHDVIHRDLKPENLMVADFGEVRVVDWGLARRARDPRSEPAIDLGPRPAGHTRVGQVVGTPGYMAPEQAAGRIDRMGPEADVYALGAVLYTLLTGHAPYAGRAVEMLRAVLRGPPAPLDTARIDAGLRAICTRAMARQPSERYLDAGELAEAVGAWLDGEERRAEATVQVARARERLPEMADLRQRAEGLRAEADRLLASVAPEDPVSARQPAWELQDRADVAESELALREVTWHQELRAALSRDPELPEAHALLADHYRDALDRAERGRDPLAVARNEALLRVHDRGRHAAFLAGTGALTLRTTTPAEARLYRYVEQQRRLVPVFERALGTTPLCEVPVAKGPWLVTLDGGGPVVHYPVRIDRAAHWDGVPPGGKEALPIWVPGPGDLPDDAVYVPAGWCIVGGDPFAADSLPRQEVWVDGFVMGRFPVTSATYARFLEALLAEGDEAAFEACRPESSREAPGVVRAGGRVTPALDPNLPVTGVSHAAAARAAAWLGGRLPNELELEKAARGVDGRTAPWGRELQARWSRVLGSPPSPPGLLPVGAIPEDEGPYGIRDLAGNARTWCRNWWSRGGPIRGARVVDMPETGTHRAMRGGFYGSPPATQRAATRFGNFPEVRSAGIGLRAVWEPPAR